jgi:catechol 2,3-dioxygenase-like lactoylglutathione lyase family enzyme
MFKDIKAVSSFSVDDLAKAKDFYTRILGLGVSEDSEGLYLHTGGGGKIFVYPKKNHIPATYTILIFPVDNIDVAVEELKRKGIKFEHYEGDIKTDEKGIARESSNGQGPDAAWFKDPAGNFLSVIEEKM